MPLKLLFKENGKSLEKILKEKEFLIKSELERLIIDLGKREERRSRVTHLFYVIGNKENPYEKALELIKERKEGYYFVGIGKIEGGKVKLRNAYFFEKKKGKVQHHELFKVNLYLKNNFITAYFDSNLNIRDYEIKKSK